MADDGVGDLRRAPQAEHGDADPQHDRPQCEDDDQERGGEPVARAGCVGLSCLDGHPGHCQPPIGARGFAPQNTSVPIIPIRCTKTMLRTIDFAVAVPTPTGPPEAV